MNNFAAHVVAAMFAAACLDASAADPVNTACVQPGQAEAAGKSGPRQTGPTPIAKGAAVSSVGTLAGGAGGGAASASYAKVQDPNAGMPNRISMNVTVPKQTQGATFGEKVNQGLHAAGSAVAQGAPSSPGAASGCDVAGAAAAAATTEKKAEAAPAAGSDHK